MLESKYWNKSNPIDVFVYGCKNQEKKFEYDIFFHNLFTNAIIDCIPGAHDSTRGKFAKTFFLSKQYLASCAGLVMKIWDLKYKNCIQVINQTPVTNIFDYSNDYFFFEFDWHNQGGKGLGLYDYKTPKTLLSIPVAHNLSITGIVNMYNYLNQHNYFASCSLDKSLKIWDINTQKCVRTYSEHQEGITSLEFDRTNSILVTTSSDKTQRLWDVRQLKSTMTVKTQDIHPKNLIMAKYQIYFSSNGKGSVIARDLRLFSKPIYTFKLHKKKIEILQTLNEHQYVTTSNDRSGIKVWNVHGECVKHHKIKPIPLSLQSNTWYVDSKTLRTQKLLDRIKECNRGMMVIVQKLQIVKIRIYEKLDSRKRLTKEIIDSEKYLNEMKQYDLSISQDDKLENIIISKNWIPECEKLIAEYNKKKSKIQTISTEFQTSMKYLKKYSEYIIRVNSKIFTKMTELLNLTTLKREIYQKIEKCFQDGNCFGSGIDRNLKTYKEEKKKVTKYGNRLLKEIERSYTSMKSFEKNHKSHTKDDDFGEKIHNIVTENRKKIEGIENEVSKIINLNENEIYYDKIYQIVGNDSNQENRIDKLVELENNGEKNNKSRSLKLDPSLSNLLRVIVRGGGGGNGGGGNDIKERQLIYFGQVDKSGIPHGRGKKFHKNSNSISFDGEFEHGKEKIGERFNIMGQSDMKEILQSGIKTYDFNELKKTFDPFEDLEGTGTFGRVYKCMIENQQYALKWITFRRNKNIQEQIEEFKNEIKILCKTKYHPNVIRIYGMSNIIEKRDECQLFFVTEYCPKKLAGKYHEFKWTQKIKILLGVAEGMMYIHSLKILHRDLKWDNVILDALNRPKIIDLGFAKVQQAQSMYQTSRKGTWNYVSPEVFVNEQNSNKRVKYGKKSDVFSYGMMMYAFLVNKEPYEELAEEIIKKDAFVKPSEIVSEKVKNGLRPTIPDEILQEKEKEWYIDLMKKCWFGNNYEESHKRPTFEEICQVLKKKIVNID